MKTGILESLEQRITAIDYKLMTHYARELVDYVTDWKRCRSLAIAFLDEYLEHDWRSSHRDDT